MENNAKNFALQLGALISLYVSLTALISLFFGIITVAYPDSAQGIFEYESATSSIRMSIAALIVFFPTYIALTRYINTARRKEQGAYLTITRWLIYISLLIGGVAMLGDLVFIIHTFLNGELTIRFLLKALVFFVVVGSAFTYYVYDARAYWQSHERQSVWYSIAMSVIVLASIVFGYFNMEGPKEVREMRIDQRQVQDLSTIQAHIEDYFYTYAKLPSDITTAFNGVAIPVAPTERESYQYRVVNEGTYSLCALFVTESKSSDVTVSYPTYFDAEGKMVSWEHGSGEWCYTRTASLPNSK